MPTFDLKDTAYEGRIAGRPWSLPATVARVHPLRELADAGWLERRTVDANCDTAWFWTRQAETVLDMNALRRTDRAEMN